MRRIPVSLVPALLVAALSCSGGGGSSGGTTTPPASAPSIAFSSSGAVFTAPAGGASPAAQTINISNSGTGSLAGLATGTVTYGGGQIGGWLTASLNSSSAPATLTLTATTGALALGTYTASFPITASVTGITNSPQTVTASLTITAGAPTHLVFTTQPPATGSGALSPSVTVAVEDAANNIVTTATTSVTMAIGVNAGGSTLGGTTTVAAVAGVATFSNLTLDKSGSNYTIVASAAGLTSATSSVFNIVVAAASQLAFTAQPTNITAGGVITPAVAVTIRDGSGNKVVGATNSVTIAIGTNPAGGTLGGTLTVAAVAGVATFSNLTLNNVGTGYTLVAASAGLTGQTSSAFSVTAAATAVSLSVGQAQTFLASSNFSASLAVTAGAQYLIAVVNSNAAAAQSESFSLTGTFGAAVSALQFPGASSPPIPSARVTAQQGPSFEVGRLPVQMSALRGMQQTHMSLLDVNKQVYARFGNPRDAWAKERAAAGRNSQLSAAIVQTIGTVNKVYVRNSLVGGCGNVDSIGARTVAVGAHVIVLADTNLTKWPNTFRPDTSFYASFAAEFDAITYPHLVANIGNPMAFDASLSSIGKVTVIITPVLNNLAGVTGGGIAVAFVNSCDFFPSGSGQIGGGFSNKTEVFYSFVPSATGYSVATWQAQLRATAAHESKHIISFADRIINNAPSFEDIWLEEGLAQVSSEIWERNFNQATYLGAANFLGTVACEIPLGAGAPCDLNGGKPYALVGSHLPFFFQYLQSETTNGEGLGVDTPANYGAGWAISRWILDNYASGAEGALIKSLVNEPSLTGLNNLAAKTSQPVATLLTYWSLASAIFQTPGYVASDVRTTIPSFNFADIFNFGQTRLTCSGVPCGLFTNSGQPVYPLTPLAVSSATTINKVITGVPGTAASYFLFTANGSGHEALQLLTTAGQPLPLSSGLRVAILRVQ